MDFRQATNLFADPLFDGDPVQIYEPKEGDPIEPPELPDDECIEDDEEILVDPEFPEEPEPPAHRRKYYINDVEVHVVSERIQYYGDDGKLITESLRDFTKKRILKEYTSLDDFLRQWKA
jgi:type I restriction enzyme R subunit